MRTLLIGLMWAMGLSCLAIGAVHLLLGIASIPGETAAGATVDSRERFYNAIFIGYGLAWIWAARRTPTPAVVTALSALMFLGGLGRLLSAAVHGWPHWFQLPLTAIELVLPPLYAGLAVAATRRVPAPPPAPAALDEPAH